MTRRASELFERKKVKTMQPVTRSDGFCLALSLESKVDSTLTNRPVCSIEVFLVPRLRSSTVGFVLEQNPNPSIREFGESGVWVSVGFFDFEVWKRV